MVEVKLDKFAGPLHLLLKLIEKEKLDITEVSLAQVASQFIDYLKKSEEIDPDEVADFLVIASRLLLIKSKALLPYLYPEEEEEIDNFETQLKMYKEYLEAAKQINQMLDKKEFMFAREFNRKVVLVNRERSFSPPPGLACEQLAETMRVVIDRVRPVAIMEEKTIADNINIEDKIFSIQQLVAKRIKLSFNKVMREAKSKTEVIVSFLAMLELMRSREVTLVQDTLFSEIIIHKK